MTLVIYRKTNEQPPLITEAAGYWLTDSRGNHYLDLSGGPCAFSLGYSNEHIQKIMRHQIERLPSVFSGSWSSMAAVAAGNQIELLFDEELPGWLGGILFLQGGGEAVDLACKLAAQYQFEQGKTFRHRIASRDHAFHGVGTIPFSLSGFYPRYKKIYDWQALADKYVVKVPHTWDCDTERALLTTKVMIEAVGVAALIIEPVNGPNVGAWVEQKAYIQGLRKICDDAGILLIFDEVLCGSGRCGYMTTATWYGVRPDIIILGKSLSAGYEPVSAILISKEVREVINSGSKQIMWGTTHSAHAMGCSAVFGALSYMRDNHLLRIIRNRASDVKGAIEWELELMQGRDSVVQSVHGMGFYYGLHLVNPETQAPFPAKTEFHALARKCILDEGAVVYSKGQTIRGEQDFIIIAPAFEMSRDALYQGMSMVAKGLKRAWSIVKARKET